MRYFENCAMFARMTGACFALALAFCASIGLAEAGTVTTTFNVTANVQVACKIAATDLDFGTYDKSAAAALQASSNLLVDCTNGAAWDIALNKGDHGASVTTRQMANNTDNSVLLNYSLFADPAHTLNWGETAGTDTVNGSGTGSIQAVGVYGQIPAHQTTVTAGGYSDTITATLTF
jgi:spore coat protein U-like protein